MLTEEQWLARQKQKDAGGTGDSASSSGEARRRPRGGRNQKGKTAKGGERGGGGHGAKAGGDGGDHKANRDDLCLNCRRPGHWAKDCPEPRRERGGAAHVAQADDGEAALFLRKALYGLRQAPRAWNAKLDNTLKALGFQQSAHEAAMYRRGSGRTVLLVGVYVDDLSITGTAEDEVEAFKAQMKQPT